MTTKMDELIIAMLSNAPDPNEPLPLSNRKETIYGTTIPFLIVSWFAVLLRLWTRFKIMREPGWDDFFVTLSAICNTIATICVLISIDYGLGRHYLYIGIPNMKKYVMLFYIENAIYICQTALIKISLLLQYLRIFKAGTMRWVCLSLLVIILLWGTAYGFLAWFPCFPVKGYWDRTINAKCYGYGFEFATRDHFVALFESHTALNMTFDLAVFLTPMVLFKVPNLSKKSLIGMIGVFLFGAVVVFTSVWRLYTIVLNKSGTSPYIDFTWWTPISIVLSCLEINLAIICASMPIFWPVIESKFSQIFVTNEIHITEHRRINDDELGYELERSGSMKSGRTGSRTSEVALTRQDTEVGPLAHYQDQYVVAQVDPLAIGYVPGATVETEIESQPKPKWKI